MKRAIQWTWLIFFMLLMTADFPPAWGAPPAGPDATGQTVAAGYLENIAFEKLPGKERVILTVSKQSGATVENQPGNAVAVRLENLFVPEGLRRSLEDPSLANVVRVTPVQKTADGRSWVLATIELRRKVPYSVRSEGMNVLIDFNVTSLASAAVSAPEKPLPLRPQALKQAAKPAEVPATPAKDAARDAGEERKVYTGSRFSLDVQDADIKSVFKLLAEEGNVNIVYGEDVKGKVTLSIKNVPWDQVLDTILTINGLGKIREGNVTTVMTLEKMKKDEADRQAALEAKRKAEVERARPEPEPFITRVVKIDYADAQKLTANILDLLPKEKDGKTVQGSVKVDEHNNSLIIQTTRQEMTRLQPIIERIDKPTAQILIKANIVETTKSTARNLGIQWGGMWGQNVGNQNLFVNPGGVGGSTVPPGSALSGGYVPTSGITGIGGQGYGVNFPAAPILGAGPASLGLLFGTIGGNILDVQLSALQKDGKLNILSSPSLVTLDNQTASTENGEDVPFVTPATATSPATVTWKKAVLRLEIKPHVIDGKNIKMTILVRKDQPNYSRSVEGNPPIFVKETKTDLVVADGETIVISGLTKETKDSGISGVPWLKEIPVLGWLFKGEGKTEDMEEVLIFITPNIMKPQEMAGIQTGP